jgi:hypothetical protein
MKAMMKSEFVKSNVKLMATILIMLLLLDLVLLKVVKRNHRVHLILQTTQITLKIQIDPKEFGSSYENIHGRKGKLSDSDLDTFVDKFKNKKDRYMML